MSISSPVQQFGKMMDDFQSNLFNAGKDRLDEESSTNSWSFIYEKVSFESVFQSQLDQPSVFDSIDLHAEDDLMNIENQEPLSEESLPDIVKNLVRYAASLLPSSSSFSSTTPIDISNLQRVIQGFLMLVEEYGSFDALEAISEINNFVRGIPLTSDTISDRFESWFSAEAVSFQSIQNSNEGLTETDVEYISMTMHFQSVVYLENSNHDGKNDELITNLKESDEFVKAQSHFSGLSSEKILGVKTIDEALMLAKSQLESLPNSVDEVLIFEEDIPN